MQIEVQAILNYLAYWVLFWQVVNILLPPREIFETTPAWYNTLLKVVAYYGALNLRGASVKLYSAVRDAPPDKLNVVLDKASAAAKETAAAVSDAKAVVSDPTKP